MFHHSSFAAKSFSPQSFRFDEVGIYETAVIHGGGYDFLDSEWHQRRINSKAREIIAKAARKAAQSVSKTAAIASDSDFAQQQIAELQAALERDQIAWNRFYAALLARQIDRQLTEQIRLALMQLGIYEQIRIEEEDEQAILMLMMDM